MLCNNCNQKEAQVFFTRIINGDVTEIRLCDACAREKGEIIPGSLNAYSIHSFFSDMLKNPSTYSFPNKSTLVDTCNNCGMTYTQFSKQGRFGCSDCYQTFNHRLDPLFRKLHRNTAHVGKIPNRASAKIKLKREIENLRSQINLAIQSEEFEKAAELRDVIKKLESQ